MDAAPQGLPPHKLTLKVGSIFMLLRNLDVARGKCNGSRFAVVDMHDHSIKAKHLTGPRKDRVVIIPRIHLDSNETDALPCRIERTQLPIRLAHVMTITKSQGQTLKKVGIDCLDPVFAHGMLFTALTRGRKAREIKVRLPPGQTKTRNIVYKEVLPQNWDHGGLAPMDVDPPAIGHGDTADEDTVD